MIAAIQLATRNDTTNAYPRILFRGDITLPDTFIPGLGRFGGKMESVAARTVASAPGISSITFWLIVDMYTGPTDLDTINFFVMDKRKSDTLGAENYCKHAICVIPLLMFDEISLIPHLCS